MCVMASVMIEFLASLSFRMLTPMIVRYIFLCVNEQDSFACDALPHASSKICSDGVYTVCIVPLLVLHRQQIEIK